MMKTVKGVVLPIFLATIWIGVSEFVRNELLFKSYWVDHYRNLGIEFPSEIINGIVWGIWSLCFAIAIFIFLRKYSLLQTFLLSFFIGFVLMWLVAGNLGVLPYNLLPFAVPLALLESFVATYIISIFNKK
jgi:Na+-translocating ferredoxin:NAD+ oxidoreductase RnfE subunit